MNVYETTHATTMHMEESKESVLSFHHVGPGDWIHLLESVAELITP